MITYTLPGGAPVRPLTANILRPTKSRDETRREMTFVLILYGLREKQDKPDSQSINKSIYCTASPNSNSGNSTNQWTHF